MLWPRRVYFDHNATTPVDPKVARTMARVLKKRFGNPASLHSEGRLAEGIVRRARAPVAALVGAPPERVFFTSGGTESNNAALKGIFTARGGGHVVTTRIEHESVLGACAEIERRGGRVTYLDAGPDGRVDVARVRDALRPDTILVSVMHANNETGAVQPVEAIAAVCRTRGVPFHTDAVQTAGKIAVDVSAIGCELMSFTAHKINGPKGVGALYWRGEHRLEPLVAGGDQESGVRAGTVAVHQVAGFGRAAELRLERWRGDLARLAPLRRELVDGIRRLWPSAVVNGADGESQLPSTVNATFPGRSGLHLLAGLDCFEIGVSIGSACTADRIEPSHVLLGMGLTREAALSSIRLSMGGTTSRRDAAYLLEALARVLEGDPGGLGYLDPQHLTLEKMADPGVFLVDLRMPYHRVRQAKLPGAHRWSFVGFDKRLAEVPRDREAVLVCDTGVFSLTVGYRLARKGHPRVRVVYGGWNAFAALHPEVVEKLEG